VERLLLEELDRELDRARSEPDALARPLRVIVPSRSLAQHLAVRISRRAGRARLGLSVRTVHAVACEILARAGVPLPPGEELFELLVRRAARAEPALAPLAALEDGHSAVAASVRDLLDAGLEPAHAEALDEALAAEAGDPAARARAVVRIASALAAEIEAGRLGHLSALYRAAREAFERDPDAALPSRAILIHGFADATGVVTDLLEALVRRSGATLFLDRPPDPAEPSREESGSRFGERFAARMLGAPPPAPEAAEAPGEVAVLHAQGAWAEAHAVAEELRAALDRGEAAPEDLGVVARELGAHRLALRTHLRRLAVPFSGAGEPGPPGAAGRRLADLLALLREGPRARAERWIDALEIDGVALGRPGSQDAASGPRLSPTERADLRIGLLALGAARLGQVGELATAGAAADVELPLRAGLVAEEGGGARAPRRRLRRALLDAAIGRAGDLLHRLAELEDPPLRRPLAERARAVREIARLALGWRDGDPGASELDSALAELGPPELALDAEELRLLLGRRLAAEGRTALGGAGGGVQILTVTEARGRTFERLWILGLQRDAFPRSVIEDPLLPDELRARLRVLLPDLARKRDGHDEERFLFAGLVAASPRVALLASTCDDDGRAQEISPLVERLRDAPCVREPRALPSATAREALAAPGARPAGQRALLAGLHGSDADFEALLPAALEEAWREEEAPIDARSLAAGRVAVLREIDRPAHRAGPLGPYFGFVGGLRPDGDPRRGAVAVTTLERIFRCPWQTFLERVLRIEAPPDAGGELPAADPRRLGSLVHGVLERIAKASLGAPVKTLDEAAARAPVSVAWPPEAELGALARELAREILREEGVALAGFERVLALAAAEALEVARACDREAQRAGSGLVGAEIRCSLALEDARGAPRRIELRADRVDRRDGALLLTDYKTGRPAIALAGEEARRAKLLASVAEGALLQGPAYAALARERGGGAGRYLYLREDATGAARELAVEAGDRDLAQAFEGAARRAFGAWDEGAFFPRLVEPDGEKEGRACRRCLLREACVKGDSAARARLARFAGSPPRGRRSAAVAALLGIWSAGEQA
jgi:hypothetical protein